MVPEHVAALHRYGLEIGYAFQIADDVLDYAGDLKDTGKTRGQDLRDGKLTLPVILACERDPGLARAVERLLASGPGQAAGVAEIVERVAASPALEAASRAAAGHADRAVEQLAALPPSLARDALAALARYVVRRDR